MSYETLIVEIPSAGVTVIRLNRPEALNALNAQLLGELATALDVAEVDDSVRCLVLTGSDRAFAAGALDLRGQHLRRSELCRARPGGRRTSHGHRRIHAEKLGPRTERRARRQSELLAEG